MRLSKHHGLGNDFLVLLDHHPGAADPHLVRRLCDRRRGVGADGLILARPGPPGADLVMVLHNADGTRAEMSGNGIRCLAQAEARRRGAATVGLTVATDAGPRRCQVAPGPDPLTAQVAVGMGSVRLVPPPERLPDPAAAKAVAADVGNPHLVLLVEDVAAVDVSVGATAGVNVEWVAPTPDGGLDLVVWERGVGATPACGTGACAAAAAARHWGVAGDRVSVRMPGGAVEVVLDGDQATLVGPATFVADVEVPDRWR